MTTRTCTRYHRSVKNMTSKQSRLSKSSTNRSDYDEDVYRNSRSARPLIALLSVVAAFWAGVLIWAIREIF